MPCFDPLSLLPSILPFLELRLHLHPPCPNSPFLLLTLVLYSLDDKYTAPPFCPQRQKETMVNCSAARRTCSGPLSSQQCHQPKLSGQGHQGKSVSWSTDIHIWWLSNHDYLLSFCHLLYRRALSPPLREGSHIVIFNFWAPKGDSLLCVFPYSASPFSTWKLQMGVNLHKDCKLRTCDVPMWPQ